jgi:ubiquinone/menaquinone biosynthesis C-methylase UbiE
MQSDTPGHEVQPVAPRAFTPALPVLRLYDLVVRFATREHVWRAAALARLAPTDDDVLVDAGCGTGSFLARIGQSAPGARLIGVDPDARILARARGKLARAGVAARLERGYLSDVDGLLGGGIATKVTSTLVLHQVPLAEKRAGLAACHRLLASGGRVVIADYGRQRSATMRTLFKLVQYVDGFADTQPNADGIVPQLLRDAGFVDVEETDVFATATGSVSIYRATKPAGGDAVAAGARQPEGTTS